MKVETVDLKVRLKEPLGLYVAQIASELDADSGRLIAPEAQWQTIKSAMDMACASQDQQPFSFFITPEVSTPFSAIDRMLKRIESDDYPVPSVSVFGIEIVHAAEGRDTIRDSYRNIRHDPAFFEQCLDEQPVNAVLIAVRSRKRVDMYLQPKLTSSKFEGDVYRVGHLHVGEVLYRFTTPDLAFATLICSDFFLADRTGRRIIDAVDFELMKGRQPLDLVINVQHNRAPDHELFRHSLGRLYDRDAPAFCTLFVNSARHERGQRGASKILFPSGQRVRPVEPVKPYDAPVVGYEVTGEECLVHVELQSLPKNWTSTTYDPVVTRSFARSGDRWVADGEHLRFVARPESPRLSADYLYYEDLAARAGDLGLYDNAVEWLTAAAGKYEHVEDYAGAARVWHRIAVQYRNKGRYLDAQQAYAESERFLYKVPEQKALRTRMLRWKLLLGKALAEQYHLYGDVHETRRLGERFAREIEDVLRTERLTAEERFDLETVKLHMLRQLAELNRMSGRVGEAIRQFDEAFRDYHYVYRAEKAYSLLGRAESLRVAGEWKDAEESYRQVMIFASHAGETRLQMRVYRGRAEMMRAQELFDECESALQALAECCDRTPYVFGTIYAHLIRGGMLLQRGSVADAQGEMERALSLAQQPAFDLGIETRFARLGLAEALRLSGSQDAVDAYRALEKQFHETGVAWGERTARLGAELALRNDRERVAFINIP